MEKADIKKLSEEYERIYSAIIDLSGEIDERYLDYIAFGLSEKTKDLMKQVSEKVGELHEVAHELEEHLAWDDDI